MSKTLYSKHFLSYRQQLDQLIGRGLVVVNEEKALHLLEHISYYRLSGYWYPLLENKQEHIFKKESTFQTAFNLYCFDRKLRQLVLSEIEKIEVAIRAKITYIMAEENGPFWFTKLELFSNSHKHGIFLNKLEREYNRSDEEFIIAFNNKYSDPFPPSWMSMEITSFGTVSLLYKNLKPSKEKRDIARHFGLADVVFSKWLHSLVYLRNVCAHHTRLWNRSMSIRPSHPRRTNHQWLNNTNIGNDRAYFILSMILYFLQSINPHNSFSYRFQQLLNEYNNIDLRALGFPVNWEDEPLWKE